MTEAAVDRQTQAELAHWQLAAEALADLDTVAAPEAWQALEDYLQRRVRDRLSELVAVLVAEGKAARRMLGHGGDPGAVRQAVLKLRTRYLQVETILDFYGHAVNSRTNPALRAVLRGYDTLAGDSMAAILTRLGLEPPPALVYLDHGLGASILRAGIRLWDHSHPSPAAAIKLTRHNLAYPTALLHETGHQVAHLTGWNTELADALAARLAPRSAELARTWRDWAGEIAGDVHAFVQAGWAPVAALANVVDGATPAVYRERFGDPHPFPFLRVMFNVELCRRWFGTGPWDDLAAAWQHRHPVDRATGDTGALARASLPVLGDIVDVCTRLPMAAFGGKPLSALLDPGRVSPSALTALARQAGPSLLTSAYLRRREPLRILALLSTRAVLAPEAAADHQAALLSWVTSVGADAAPAAPHRAA